VAGPQLRGSQNGASSITLSLPAGNLLYRLNSSFAVPLSSPFFEPWKFSAAFLLHEIL
jgi:hypothetical protein